MDLNTLCFILFGVLLIGYLVLEGCDYGVGMLLPFFGNTDVERQAIIKTLAPVWEGNEVWLLAAGAFLFAGFPNAYATMFSGMYLVLLLLLASLILRGAAFEFRDKETTKTWRLLWDWSIFAGGLIPALFWGIALSSLLNGLPVNGEMQYIGTLGDLLSIYSLTGGLTFVFLFAVYGVTYLALKLELNLVPRLRRTGLRLCKYCLAVTVIFGMLTFIYTDLVMNSLTGLLLMTAITAIFLVRLNLHTYHYRRCFIYSTIAIVSVSLALFLGLFPRIMISSLDSSWTLTIYNSASNALTLTIMSITMLIVLPLLITLEIWKYYIFRHRVSLAEIQFGSYASTLIKMNKELKSLLMCAACLADALSGVIRALRSNDGGVIKRLTPKSIRLLFKKRPQKFNGGKL